MEQGGKPRQAVRMGLLLAIAVMASACSGGGEGAGAATGTGPAEQPEPSPTASPTPLTVTSEELANADFVLFTGGAPQGFDNGGYGFDEAGISSPGPTIRVAADEPLTVVLQNVSDEFLDHDFTVVAKRDESAEPLWGAQTLAIVPGESDAITFTPDAPGRYFYICSLPGHMSSHGMWGRFVVE